MLELNAKTLDLLLLTRYCPYLFQATKMSVWIQEFSHIDSMSIQSPPVSQTSFISDDPLFAIQFHQALSARTCPNLFFQILKN